MNLRLSAAPPLTISRSSGQNRTQHSLPARPEAFFIFTPLTNIFFLSPRLYIDINKLIPPAGIYHCADGSGISPVIYYVPVAPRPKGAGGGQIINSLKQIGLALRVQAGDDVDMGIKKTTAASVVPETVQFYAVYDHCLLPTSIARSPHSTLSPGYIFFPL
jgi:hypothetical protein